MMTRKDAVILVGCKLVYGPGYCTRYDYDKAMKELGKTTRLVFMGSNSGVYGWNWSLYYDAINEWYIVDSYRNAPRLQYVRSIEQLKRIEGAIK